METFMSDEERQKVNSFKNEHRLKFESEQQRLRSESERKGETYTPEDYVEVSDKDALDCVRAGWKSWLDKQFEKKRLRETAQGIQWANKGR